MLYNKKNCYGILSSHKKKWDADKCREYGSILETLCQVKEADHERLHITQFTLLYEKCSLGKSTDRKQITGCLGVG